MSMWLDDRMRRRCGARRPQPAVGQGLCLARLRLIGDHVPTDPGSASLLVCGRGGWELAQVHLDGGGDVAVGMLHWHRVENAVAFEHVRHLRLHFGSCHESQPFRVAAGAIERESEILRQGRVGLERAP